MTFICPFHRMYYLGHYEINVHIFHLRAKHLHGSPCDAVILLHFGTNVQP